MKKRENFFRKMLQQGGGRFRFDGKDFEVKLRERILNSDGEKDGGVVKIPGDSRF